MYILGLHLGDSLETDFNRSQYTGHDAAAVLLKDGEIIAGIEEERLCRVKHCNFFPERAIRFCLQSAGVSLQDVDAIALNCSEHDGDIKNAVNVYNDSTLPWQSADNANAEYLTRLFGQEVTDKIVYCPHHEAHAWSAFVPSGFSESLVVVFDGNGPSGDGKMLSGLVGINVGNHFHTIEKLAENKSIGTFYRNAIRSIGYNRFDEYKVMGLAPYGDPSSFSDLLKDMYLLKDEGDFSLAVNPSYEIWRKRGLADALKPPRRKGQKFTQTHKDFAASIQGALEDIALHCIRHFQAKTGMRNLSFAGGVAHNCTLNKKIIDSGLFEDVYIQPAAHDAGCAIGAAYFAYNKLTGKSLKAMPNVYWGSTVPAANQISAHLAKWGDILHVTPLNDTCKDIAQLLADGAVIGWVQGKSEFGPRALGNRSILADPRPEENKKRINKMIKKREGYRPFAPSVLQEKAKHFFDIQMESKSLPFMNIVVDVKPEYQKTLGAITHVDGTARIQTVARTQNEKYWSLIEQFGQLTGVPILLNTSFNNHAEPIVDSIDDAITCYLTTELSHLVIGDFLITRKFPWYKEIGRLSASIRPSYVVAKGEQQSLTGRRPYFAIESKTSRFFQREQWEISQAMFEILSQPSGSTLQNVCDKREIAVTNILLDEIYEAWQNRLLVLAPL